ncbi:OsmC family protein [Lacinutrix gracilariae]|uniref:OsmC family protein n=1 Tax=Lacinutrix gracilariae TaxID=1747198 RepID=A0ABW5K2W9_9FLAO
MKYSIQATATAKKDAAMHIKQSDINFGTTPESSDSLPNPAELFLGSFSACVLKNVERFSGFMHFDYTKAEITVNAIRLEKPPRMDEIQYHLRIYTKDNTLNIDLLKKNIEKFGTIFNTVKLSCAITGDIQLITN